MYRLIALMLLALLLPERGLSKELFIFNEANVLSSESYFTYLQQKSDLFIDSSCNTSVNSGKSALYFAKNINDISKINKAHKQLGLVYLAKNMHKESLIHLNHSVNYFRSINCTISLFEIYNGLGVIHRVSGDFAKSHHYFSNAVKYGRHSGNTEKIIRAKINAGNSLAQDENYDSAITYFYEAQNLSLSNEAYSSFYPIILNSLGWIYEQNEMLDSALIKYEKAYSYFKLQNRSGEQAILLNNISKVLIKKKKYCSVEDKILKADSINRLYNNSHAQKHLYFTAYEYYYGTEDYKSAIKYLNKAISIRDSIADIDLRRLTTEIELRHEIDLIEYESNLVRLELQRQKAVNTFFTVIIIMAIIFVLILSYFYSSKVRLNKELQSSHDKISKQNKLIYDNLHYAKHIQNSCMDLGQALSEKYDFFALNIPKNIVGGDFYLRRKAHGLEYVVCGDCTGHGISGGFLSVLAIQYFDYAITSYRELKDISREVSNKFYEYFGKSDYLANESLSFCIVMINKTELRYCGSHQRLWIVSGGELSEYKFSNTGVGYKYDEEFAESKAEIKKGDLVYLSSDGYPDQFGGEKSKKLKYPAFRDIIKKSSKLDFDSQKSYLEKRFNDWKKDGSQTDDILLIGLKVI